MSVIEITFTALSSRLSFLSESCIVVTEVNPCESF